MADHNCVGDLIIEKMTGALSPSGNAKTRISGKLALTPVEETEPYIIEAGIVVERNLIDSHSLIDMVENHRNLLAALILDLEKMDILKSS